MIEPQWATEQDITEIYTNEKYNFDMRVKSLSRDRVSIRFTSTFGDKNKLVENSSISVGPYKKSGKLTFETLVDGTPLKDLTHSVSVKELPAPSVDFKRRPEPRTVNAERKREGGTQTCNNDRGPETRTRARQKPTDILDGGPPKFGLPSL